MAIGCLRLSFAMPREGSSADARGWMGQSPALARSGGPVRQPTDRCQCAALDDRLLGARQLHGAQRHFFGAHRARGRICPLGRVDVCPAGGALDGVAGCVECQPSPVCSSWDRFLCPAATLALTIFSLAWQEPSPVSLSARRSSSMAILAASRRARAIALRPIAGAPHRRDAPLVRVQADAGAARATALATHPVNSARSPSGPWTNVLPGMGVADRVASPTTQGAARSCTPTRCRLSRGPVPSMCRPCSKGGSPHPRRPTADDGHRRRRRAR